MAWSAVMCVALVLKPRILVQRETAAVIQASELMHVDVHAPVFFMRQLRPGTQGNDRHATWIFLLPPPR